MENFNILPLKQAQQIFEYFRKNFKTNRKKAETNQDFMLRYKLTTTEEFKKPAKSDLFLVKK